LKRRGCRNLVTIDKHPSNTATLRRLHPDITVIEADLAEAGPWEAALSTAAVLILNHAQIGGLSFAEFERNNIAATKRVLEVIRGSRKPPFIVHISSSVVNSRAIDFYTESKKAQERLVKDSGLPCTVLRPTLMFGWFDRKHLGWLARFMQRAPIFPVPDDGNFVRQPLYVGDFCNVVIACLDGRFAGRTFDISGLERISYIEIIREIKQVVGARALILRLPYRVFWWLLRAYALVDKNPPFTTRQLEALVLPEVFPVIDWPGIFSVACTRFRTAVERTFKDPTYSKVVLEF
jgi:nucleoside-diphosphate-sugar epimerase